MDLIVGLVWMVCLLVLVLCLVFVFFPLASMIFYSLFYNISEAIIHLFTLAKGML